jgi:hypothetical protein
LLLSIHAQLGITGSRATIYSTFYWTCSIDTIFYLVLEFYIDYRQAVFCFPKNIYLTAVFTAAIPIPWATGSRPPSALLKKTSPSFTYCDTWLVRNFKPTGSTTRAGGRSLGLPKKEKRFRQILF